MNVSIYKIDKNLSESNPIQHKECEPSDLAPSSPFKRVFIPFCWELGAWVILPTSMLFLCLTHPTISLGSCYAFDATFHQSPLVEPVSQRRECTCLFWIGPNIVHRLGRVEWILISVEIIMSQSDPVSRTLILLIWSVFFWTVGAHCSGFIRLERICRCLGLSLGVFVIRPSYKMFDEFDVCIDHHMAVSSGPCPISPSCKGKHFEKVIKQ